MKAILIKKLNCTDKKPARFKAMLEGKDPFIRSETDIDLFHQLVVNHYQLNKFKTCLGRLPNGDYAITLSDPEVIIYVDLCALNHTDCYTLIGNKSDCLTWCEQEMRSYGYCHFIVVKTLEYGSFEPYGKVKKV